MADVLVKHFWQDFVIILPGQRILCLDMVEFVNIDTDSIRYNTMNYNVNQLNTGHDVGVNRLSISLSISLSLV
jgi:hypothetical protein